MVIQHYKIKLHFWKKWPSRLWVKVSLAIKCFADQMVSFKVPMNVSSVWPSDTIGHLGSCSTLIQVCPGTNFQKNLSKYTKNLSTKCILICYLQFGSHFAQILRPWIDYAGKIKSMSLAWLLIPWLLASTGHLELWYLQCSIKRDKEGFKLLA